MELAAPRVLDVAGQPDEALDTTPDTPAVFLILAREGAPYLGRTSLLRRRLKRLLGARETPSRLLNLRGVAERVEFWPTASRLESSLVLYELARRHYPDEHLKLLKLRMPPYLRVALSNRFPRTQVTTRIAGARALHYGPFRRRAAADLFEGQFLDLFQVRRCQEDLAPSPDHPGCIYGEMGMCLRPCQEVVGEQEYGSEVKRMVEFLQTGGRAMVETITRARDRLSEELCFEDAEREHKRLERVTEVLRLKDELAADIDRLCGVAVTPSTKENAVELWFVLRGGFLAPRRFGFEVAEGQPVSIDRRLREIAAALEAPKLSTERRQEELALLGRWYYSSWRDGEWLGFEDLSGIPYRRLVNAIHRVATAS